MVNCQAFGSMGEAYLVRLIREIIPAFDPQLANTVHAVRMTGGIQWSPEHCAASRAKTNGVGLPLRQTDAVLLPRPPHTPPSLSSHPLRIYYISVPIHLSAPGGGFPTLCAPWRNC